MQVQNRRCMFYRVRRRPNEGFKGKMENQLQMISRLIHFTKYRRSIRSKTLVFCATIFFAFQSSKSFQTGCRKFVFPSLQSKSFQTSCSVFIPAFTFTSVLVLASSKWSVIFLIRSSLSRYFLDPFLYLPCVYKATLLPSLNCSVLILYLNGKVISEILAHLTHPLFLAHFCLCFNSSRCTLLALTSAHLPAVCY